MKIIVKKSDFGGEMPNFDFIGDMSGSVAKSVSGKNKLTPYDSRSAASADLLIDGSTSDAVALDTKTVKQVLEASHVVALVQPSEEHLNSIFSVTGQRPRAGCALVAYRVKPSKTGYNCLCVPNVTVKSTSIGDKTPEVSSTIHIEIDLGDCLARADALLADAEGASSNFTPVTGTYYGSSTVVVPVDWTVPPPTINGNDDDKNVNGASLNISSTLTNNYYIYWSNATASNPSYLVALQQTGNAALPAVLANNQDTQGWFQCNFMIENAEPANSNNNPLPQGVTVVASPASQSVSPGVGVPVSLSTNVGVWANTGTGVGATSFAVSVEDAFTTADWAIQWQGNGTASAWEIYQNSTWNPINNSPDTFSSWWQNVYNGGTNNVTYTDSMPTSSFGSIPFDLVTFYTFNDSLFTVPTGSNPLPPAALTVVFTSTLNQTVALLHDWNACNSGHHHLFTQNAYSYVDWAIALDQAAGTQYGD